MLRYFVIAAALTTLARASAVPQCWAGIAGEKKGAGVGTCQENDVFMANKYDDFKLCDVRILEECRANDVDRKYALACSGNGDGDKSDEPADKAACQAVTGDKVRDSAQTLDGTTNFCYWGSKTTEGWNTPKWDTDKATACTTSMKTAKVDDKCSFKEAGDCKMYPGNIKKCNVPSSCMKSTAELERRSKWWKEKGTDCGERLKSGCFFIKDQDALYGGGGLKMEDEFGTANGGKTKCSDAKAEAACNAIAPGRASITNSSGTFDGPMQKCSWVAKPATAAAAAQCANKGKGSMGICSYDDGQGKGSTKPWPDKGLFKGGFDHKMFVKGPEFTTKCSMLASFRTGKGSATVLGANTKGLIENQCKNTTAWRDVAKHIGHTDETIKEYCDNFIPDTKAMDATLKTHSAGAIIAGVKKGEFATLFPGFKDQKFIVTAKPAYGECLFTSNMGVWGAAICTCDTALCNNFAALSLIVNRTAGPMRLLQFLDGSLADLATAINAVVPGLMDVKGIFVASKAGGVTEANVVDILKIASVAAKTNKNELWGLVQDFQKLNKEIAAAPPPAPTTGKTTGTTTGKTTGATTGATTGTKKDKKLVMKGKLNEAAKAKAKKAGKDLAASYKKLKDLKKADDAKLSAAGKEKAKTALAEKKKTWSAKKKKKFKGKMNLKGIDMTKTDDATKNAKIAFEEATVAELGLTPEDEIKFTYAKVAARRRLLAVVTEVSYEITVAEDTSAALEAKLTEDPEGTAILAMSAALSTDFPESVTADVMSETVEDIAAPTTSKLNAATARAQTSAAVGAVSLVAVLSYFM